MRLQTNSTHRYLVEINYIKASRVNEDNTDRNGPIGHMKMNSFKEINSLINILEPHSH